MARKLTPEQRGEIRDAMTEMQGDLREMRAVLERYLDRREAEKQKRERRRRLVRRLLPFLPHAAL